MGSGYSESHFVRVDQLTPPPTSAEPLEIPAELQDSVRRHQRHLVTLIASLRAAGLQEALIDANVRALVDSYAAELSAAIHAMMKDSPRG